MTVTSSMSSNTIATDHSDHSEPPPGDIADILGRLKQAIWKRRPILGEIMQKHGDKILFKYSQDFLDVNPSPLLDARKQEFISISATLVEERMGSDVAKTYKEQLTRMPLVSTADHHAPIDHPFWVNANLITAIPALENEKVHLPLLIVFSFASVSLNNLSGYPRGIQFYGGMNGSKNIQRLPILPDRYKMSVVYATPAFTKEDVTRAKKELRKRQREKQIADRRADAVEEIIHEYFDRDDVLSMSSLSAQITKINYRLWPKLFHAAKGQEDHQTVPNLLYLEIETVVTTMLLQKHLVDSSSLLHRMLFEDGMKELVLKHFNNVPGAFSLEKDWGTYMFWGLDTKGHRVRMYVTGNEIHSKEKTIVVPLTPEGIATALREKKIFPSMLLCYLMVSLYYGMKCLGGFCQVNDLTLTKQRFQDFLREIGETVEADALDPVQTKELGGDGMVLAYTRTIAGDLIPGSGIDMMLSEADTRVEKYIERSKSVTLSQMMDSMLPEMYTVLYPSQDRDPTLCSVSPEEILRFTGLHERLMSEITDKA